MEYIEGNLIKLAKSGEFDVIVHGCNTGCVMGSGIAPMIAAEWPDVRHADNITVFGGAKKLGSVIPVYVSPKLVVMNAYTQESTGKGLQISYEAIDSCFRIIKEYERMNPGIIIGIPKIGAGLGGGDWDRIVDIIDAHGFRNLHCVLYKG